MLYIELEILKRRIKTIISINNQKNIQENTKFFCVGRNKTGTTSLTRAFKRLNYVVGSQRHAELLMNDYFKGDFKRIINFCQTGEVFQDVPFSLPKTYIELDKAYPNSKFILTVRDSSEQWYQSVTNFQTKIFGEGNLPTWDELKQVKYVYRGWTYLNRKNIYSLTEKNHPYDKEKLIAHYEKHNNDVINYFKNRPEKLLILNLSEKNAYLKFCEFVGVKPIGNSFPWENKTEEIKV